MSAMGGRTVERIETAIDSVAAALFAAAVGFAVGYPLRDSVNDPQLEIIAGATFAASYFACIYVLRSVVISSPRHPLPEFSVLAFEYVPLDELVLTDDDRRHPPGEEPLVLTAADRLHSVNVEPLVLDDILAEIDDDSRVVRLFDPSPMPTPAQLKDRIDRHLDETPAPPDASQALFEALAELRRSLR